jgi:hypothetical protein
MNEYNILMYLLTRSRKFDDNPQVLHIGSTEEELLSELGFSGKNAKNEYLTLLQQFNNLIGPLGLILKQNLFTRYWFLTVKSEVQEMFFDTGFLTKKSAATLATVLILCLSQDGSTTVQEIQEHRNKKDIIDDLDNLISHYLLIRDGTTIRIHPSLGYHLDFEQFLLFLDKMVSSCSDNESKL